MKGDSFSKTRVEAFSDGIFAIIVTLLVLEIKVPHITDGASIPQLAQQLVHLLPKFVSWLISFLTVCVIWVNHHRIFAQVGRVNHRLFWLNAILLLWVSFVPFPTALMGDYPLNSLAVLLYGGVMSCVAVSFFLIRRAVLADGVGLHPGLDIKAFAGARRASLLMGVVPYAAATAVAWFLPIVAIATYLAIPVFFSLPRRAVH
ncbi:MAG: TMEM175 family protein [Turneriella sp.]